MTATDHAGRPLRVVVCWAEISGYIASCFQALAQRPGVDLHVLHPEQLLNRPNPFDVGRLLDGVSNQVFAIGRRDLDAYLLDAVAAREPDAVVLCGWIVWPYTRLITAAPLDKAAKLLGMDTPWRGTAAQRVARWRLGHFARKLALLVTASDRSAEYARRIGVHESRIRPGFYGFNAAVFARAAAQRPTTWPRRFLFAGRYVTAKDLSTLVRGYAIYRDSVSDPWTLTCSGQGPEAHILDGAAGVVDAGFSQPADLPRLFAEHGAFVLASRFEPWGVVIAEAAAAGLPIICTSACGAALDIVRSYYNGVIIPPNEPEALARAMRWIHDHEASASAIGARGHALADAFGAEKWAERWHNYVIEAIERRQR
jgi:glycosyltransferase involved in cell wall biosynthesis